MIKEYTDKQYSDMAVQANVEHKKLIKVQEEREISYEVYEYEKKIIQVPIYNDEGDITGYEDKEVDDLDKPITAEEIDMETGETFIVHKHHTEYKKEIFEHLEIVDNPENFDRCFFHTSLGYIRRKPFIKGTGEYKDFLSDISAGLIIGQPILVYDKNLNQSVALVNEEFKRECLEQYNRDFNGQKQQ